MISYLTYFLIFVWKVSYKKKSEQTFSITKKYLERESVFIHL